MRIKCYTSNVLKTQIKRRQDRAALDRVTVELGADIISACDHVQLLGVITDRHVSAVRTTSFWLRQLLRVHRSLNIESAETLVHAFVTSRVDYCNLLVGG